MKNKLFLCVFLFQFSLAFSQNVKPIKVISTNLVRNTLQKVGLESSLSLAKTQAIASGLNISLPMPDGTNVTLSPIESPVMSGNLGKVFPTIKTYRLFSTETKDQITGVLTISPEGINSLLFTATGNVIIAPTSIRNDEYFVFYQNDSELIEACEIGDEHIERTGGKNSIKTIEDFTNGTILRSYRMAIATTGEFYSNNGSTQISAQAAVVSMVNSLRAVYEKEVSITFTLVATKIYTDATTDPFNPNSSSKALDAAVNFGVLSGSETASFALNLYDIGHVIHHSTGGGGVAYLNGPCNNFNLTTATSPIKAGGWSGGTTTTLSTFIHEVGHQFSAGHTFNSVNSGCNGNIMTGSAYEPGSGSTYMSYWGNCSPDNISGIVNRTYFHANSLESIIIFSTNSATCSFNTATGNNAPVVNTNPNGKTLTIPKGTPFKLEGSGSDANGETVLYNWEQYNLGTTRGGADDAQNSTASPIFRSVAPSTTGNIREFPALSTILSGSLANNDEALPQVARTITMRLTGRDGRATGGGSESETLTLNVINSGPFLITSQNTNTVWLQNTTKTITWSVNGTDNAPLNCTTVNILFSTDNGLTFPTTLIANTENDGSQTITVPTTLTATGRIKIVPANTNFIFFDINNSPISIVSVLPTCSAEVSNLTPTTTVTALAGALTLNLNLYSHSAVTNVSKTTTTTDPTMSLMGYNGSSCVTPYSNITYYKSFTFRVSTNGSYTFTIQAPVNSKNLNLFTGNFVGGCTNWIAGTINMASSPVYGSSMTATLSANTNYVMTISSTINTNSVGTVNVNFSGVGSILPPVPIENSSYSYNYVIVNNATNLVRAIQSSSDLSNATNFSAGNYTVYGISYLTDNVDFTSFVNQPFTNLQSATSGGNICALLSSNNVLVNIQNNCQNTITLNGVAITGTQAVNESITSTQVVNTGVNLTYRAGNSITLSPMTGSGFSADSGSVFKAEIGGCN